MYIDRMRKPKVIFYTLISLQNSLSRRDLILSSPRGRSLEGNRQSLESRLRTVVVVASLQDIYVHGNSGVLSKGLENVRDHLAGKLSDHLTLQAQVNGRTGTVGKVNDGAGQSLVEGSVAVSETLDTDDGTEGLLEGRSESESAVFGGVVVVDW